MSARELLISIGTAEDVRPEQRIERARRAREQLAGIERMALLRDTLAQLIDSHREYARLFQLAVELAEAGRELLALVGDLLGFRRGILGRRGPELLEALLGLARARLEVVDLLAQSVGRRVELLAQLDERLLRDVVAAGRLLDLVERRLDLLERGAFGGRLGPRVCGQQRACNQQRCSQAPPGEPPDPSMGDRHGRSPCAQ
jgi:hypothetical protein